MPLWHTTTIEPPPQASRTQYQIYMRLPPVPTVPQPPMPQPTAAPQPPQAYTATAPTPAAATDLNHIDDAALSAAFMARFPQFGAPTQSGHHAQQHGLGAFTVPQSSYVSMTMLRYLLRVPLSLTGAAVCVGAALRVRGSGFATFFPYPDAVVHEDGNLRVIADDLDEYKTRFFAYLTHVYASNGRCDKIPSVDDDTLASAHGASIPFTEVAHTLQSQWQVAHTLRSSSGVSAPSTEQSFGRLGA